MRLLLDTNILLWALIEPSKLKPDIRAMLEDHRHTVMFSVASVWEMSIKAALGHADFAVPPARIVTAAETAGFTELPISLAAALRVADLPHLHRDPFDRLLVAQAVTEPAVLYTADPSLLRYSELVVCV